nr:prolipoprotein diacylglyceryl transferase [Thiolinea sp.]
LFVILWWFSRKPRPAGSVAGLFLVLYALFRILVEFVREPDKGLGFVAFGWMTQGQLLSLPMLAAGLFIIWLAYRHPLGRSA